MFFHALIALFHKKLHLEEQPIEQSYCKGRLTFSLLPKNAHHSYEVKMEFSTLVLS